MKGILFVHNENDFTGSTKVLSDILMFEYDGYEKYLMTICRGSGFLDSLKDVNLLPVYYPLVCGKSIPLFSTLISYLHRFYLLIKYFRKYDIIYTNTIRPFYSVIWGGFFKKSNKWHIHEFFMNKSLPIRISEYVLRNFYVDEVMFVSEYIRRQYAVNKKSGVSIRRNFLYDNYLNQVLCLTPQEQICGYITMACSLSEGKGYKKFLEVARKCHELNFRLILSVSQVYNFKSLDVPDNCKVLSKQNDMHHIYRSTSVILNLTNPQIMVESFGLTLYEAMPYGIPSIAPNCGGPSELIIDDYNGYLIDVTNTEEIIKSLYKVLEPLNYLRLSKNTINRFNELNNPYAT